MGVDPSYREEVLASGWEEAHLLSDHLGSTQLKSSARKSHRAYYAFEVTLRKAEGMEYSLVKA